MDFAENDCATCDLLITKLRAEIQDIESERSRLKRELKQYELQLNAEVKENLIQNASLENAQKQGNTQY